MVGIMSRRLDRLEQAAPGDLSPEARAWLGHSLNDTERASLRPVAPVALSYVDMRAKGWSEEACGWLAK